MIFVTEEEVREDIRAMERAVEKYSCMIRLVDGEEAMREAVEHDHFVLTRVLNRLRMILPPENELPS